MPPHMSHSNTDEENRSDFVQGGSSGLPIVVENVSLSETETGASPESSGLESAQSERFFRTRKNGLSLAQAQAVISGSEGVPAVNLIWENPLADTQNMRERKMRVAAELGERFSKTAGCLSHAAGRIAVLRWSADWQKKTVLAAQNLVATAEALAEASARFAAETGLIPAGGTVAAIRDLQKLVGALLSVRGERADLVLGEQAEAELERLREAASLAENCANHKALLSLAYPEDACGNANLEIWLKWWNETEFSRAFPRWRKRRKVVAALRELAGEKTRSPLDPRVDLGNLLAMRFCKKEFADKFSKLEKAYPSFLAGMKPCGALTRIAVLEKARRQVVAARERLASVPEKCEAWMAVFARWLSGNDIAFKKSGSTEKAFEELGNALAGFDKATAELAEMIAAESTIIAGATPEEARAFAEELLSDSERWNAVCAWNATALAASRRGMELWVQAVRSGELPADQAFAAFEAEYCRRWFDAVCAADAGASA